MRLHRVDPRLKGCRALRGRALVAVTRALIGEHPQRLLEVDVGHLRILCLPLLNRDQERAPEFLVMLHGLHPGVPCFGNIGKHLLREAVEVLVACFEKPEGWVLGDAMAEEPDL